MVWKCLSLLRTRLFLSLAFSSVVWGINLNASEPLESWDFSSYQQRKLSHVCWAQNIKFRPHSWKADDDTAVRCWPPVTWGNSFAPLLNSPVDSQSLKQSLSKRQFRSQQHLHVSVLHLYTHTRLKREHKLCAKSDDVVKHYLVNPSDGVRLHTRGEKIEINVISERYLHFSCIWHENQSKCCVGQLYKVNKFEEISYCYDVVWLLSCVINIIFLLHFASSTGWNADKSPTKRIFSE